MCTQINNLKSHYKDNLRMPHTSTKIKKKKKKKNNVYFPAIFLLSFISHLLTILCKMYQALLHRQMPP